MQRLNRRQLLEIRRGAHEQYLRRRMGPSFSLTVEGGTAVVRAYEGSLEVRFAARRLFEPDALRRCGF